MIDVLSRIQKDNVYPCIYQFYCIDVWFEGGNLKHVHAIYRDF